MIRVLQVVTQMTAGGVETLLMNLYRNIDRNTIQFDFLVQTEEPGFYDAEIIGLGGRIFKVPKYKIVNQKSFENSITNLLAEHPEISIVHSHNNLFSAFVLKAAAKVKVPVRIAHSHICKPKLSSWKEIVRFCLRPYTIVLFKKYATHCFACAIGAGRWQYGKKLPFEFFHNAIDCSKFIYKPETKTRMLNELELTDSIVFGHTGRFSIQKNHVFLIDIFAHIHQECPNARLLLLGDGNLRAKMEQKCKKLGIEKSVIFAGMKQNIQDYYQVMDVFLLPSLWEGLPVTLIETQAAGIPSLISDVISNEVILTDLIKMLPLSSGSEVWAKTALEMAKINRQSDCGKIFNSEFEIHNKVAWITKFYFDALKTG